MERKALIVTCFNQVYPIFRCDLEGTKILGIKEIIDEERLPFLMQDGHTDLKTVNAWLGSRLMPETRDGIAAVRKLCRFENHHNMFSLSDQYWFQYTGREKWEKLNFFTNSYQSETGKLFFAPWTADRKRIKKEGPDITTGGILRKRWVQEETDKGFSSYLIKAGSRAGGQSPISEVLASMMMEKIGAVPFVKYSLICESLKICSICENFITRDTEYVPCSHIYFKKKREGKESILRHIVDMAERYGIERKESMEFLDGMIAVDSVTHNKDRHLNNFGFIRDVHTGKLISYAPIFDNGSAYMPIKDSASQMFREREEKALKWLAGKADGSIDVTDMITLTKAYPTITEREKEYIIKGIEEGKERLISYRENGRKVERCPDEK